MRYFYISFLFLLFSGLSIAQTVRPAEFLSGLSATDPLTKSRTIVSMDESLNRVLNREQSIDGKMVKGYRIYIFVDNSQNGRTKAHEVINRFRNAFPDITGDTLIYHIPDWKVAVGNYLTKEEAVITFGRIKGMFGSAIIRDEEIPLRNFLRASKQPSITPEETENE